MTANQKGMVAASGLLIAGVGITVYGVYNHRTGIVIAGLAVGALFSIIDWRLRKPGRSPNPRLMAAAKIIGVLIVPGALLFSGDSHLSDDLGIFAGSLILPLLLYILIMTFSTVKQKPRFWKR